MASITMNVANVAVDLALLYSLGLIGWFLGEIMRLPAAPVLGGVILVGGMRILGFDLPYLPGSVIIFLQIILGVIVGSKLDRDAIGTLKSLALPATLISSWALSLALVFGLIIAFISPLDVTTGILSSSIGGLPEMTILAHDTQADSVTVVLFHVIRMFATITVFPLIFKYYRTSDSLNDGLSSDQEEKSIKDHDVNKNQVENNSELAANNKERKNFVLHLLKIILTLIMAGIFGGFLLFLGVPAGGLVGGLLFIIFVQYFRFPVETPPDRALKWVLVGIGLMVSDQVQPETLELIVSGELILPLAFSLIFTMGSSLAVAYGIFRLTGWDFIMCFLASAPGGFTVMTGLALQEGYEPVKVSLLHLARLVTLKLVIPFLFLLFY